MNKLGYSWFVSALILFTAVFTTHSQRTDRVDESDRVSKRPESTVRNVDLSTLKVSSDNNVRAVGRATCPIDGENGRKRSVGLLLTLQNGTVKVSKLPFLSDVRSAHFLNDRVAWVEGFGGAFKTTDGGRNWIKLDYSDDVFGSIFFLDSATGWYVSTESELKFVKSDQISLLARIVRSETYPDLTFIDQKTGWLITVEEGRHWFRRTTDGGRTWTFQSPAVLNADRFSVFPDGTGYALTNEGIYKTENAGKSWQKVREGASHRLFFLNKTLGWTAGSQFCSTTNGGQSWTCGDFEPARDGNYLRDLAFESPKVGWVLTDRGLFRTLDGGGTWQRVKIRVCGDRF